MSSNPHGGAASDDHPTPSADTGANDGPGMGASPDWKQSSEYGQVKRFRLLSYVTVLILVIGAWVVMLLVTGQRPSREELARETKRAEVAYGGALAGVDAAKKSLVTAEARLSGVQASDTPDPRALDSLHQTVLEKREAVREKEAFEASTRASLNEAQRAESAATRNHWVPYAMAVVVAVAIAVIGVIASRYYAAEKRWQWEIASILTRIDSLDIERGLDALDFETLWMINKRQLHNYHKIVMNYAEATRQMTRSSLLIGFTFLVAVSTFALFARDLASAVASSVVVSAGAVVTGFIARGVLRNSETSSRELTSFLSHPLGVEKALAAERLIRTMSPEEQNPAKLLVVQFLTRTDSAQASHASVTLTDSGDPVSSGS